MLKQRQRHLKKLRVLQFRAVQGSAENLKHLAYSVEAFEPRGVHGQYFKRLKYKR